MVGLRLNAKHLLHPLQVLPVIGDELTNRLPDPLLGSEDGCRLVDRRDDAQPRVGTPSGQRRGKHLKRLSDRRRPVRETLYRVLTVAARETVASPQPGGVFGAHLVQAGRIRLAGEKVVQAA